MAESKSKFEDISYIGDIHTLGDIPLKEVCPLSLLQRVLGNMLKNALEASEAGAMVWLGAGSKTGRLSFG